MFHFIKAFFILASISFSNPPKDIKQASIDLYLFKGEELPKKAVIKIDDKEVTVYDGYKRVSLSPGDHEVKVKGMEPVVIQLKPEFKSFVSFQIGRDKKLLRLFDAKDESEDKNKADTFLCRLKGKVNSFESKSPLSEVSVVISGSESQKKTSLKGHFDFEAKVYEGMTLSFVHPTHRSLSQKITKKDCDTNFSVSLKPAMGVLDDFVVLAPKSKGSVESLLKERKNSETVSVFIGSDEFKKNGDSTAASALKRVSGLSLVEGRYAYIRGLGERYSSTTLNGATLPSPNPSRRVVPLDLLPTSLIESVAIQKSYSVDLPAQFSAGLIEVRTLSVPKKSFFKMSLSTGASSQDILAGQVYGQKREGDGGSSDFLGIDDGTRAKPKALKELRKNKEVISYKDPNDFFGDGTGLTGEELTKLGNSFNHNYDFEEVKVGPNFGFSLEGGQALKSGVNRFGGRIKGVYSLTNDYEEELNRDYNLSSIEEGLTLRDEATRYETSNRYNLGFQAGFGFDLFKSQKVNFTALTTRSTLDYNEVIENQAVGSEEDSFRSFRSFWEERELSVLQAQGEHQFLPKKALGLYWSWSQSEAVRYRPDEIEYLYELGSGDFVERAFGNQRRYSELNDDGTEFSLKLKSSHKLSSLVKLKMMAGLRSYKKDRLSDIERFSFLETGLGDSVSLNAPLNQIFNSKTISSEAYRISDTTLSSDSYWANEKNQAAFVNMSLDFKLKEDRGFSFYSGVRREEHLQGVGLYDVIKQVRAQDENELVQNDNFFSHGLIYNHNKKTSLRLTYSDTVVRPDLQEFAPVIFFDDQENILSLGNPDLKISEVSNYDLRLDYYFSAREFLSFGLFRKSFKNPIEFAKVIGTEDANVFINTESADVDGLELEVRKHVFKGLYFNGNYSLLSTEVRINEEDQGASTSDKRPLQGQSPYLLNLGLQYSSKIYGIDSNLSYNVAGKRLTQVGAFGQPDVYEEPFHQLDFTLSKKISKKNRLGFRVQNILDPESRRTQGGFVTRSFRRGRRFSVQVSTAF